MHIVVAAKPDTDQPWLTDAVTGLVRQTGATVAVVSADEGELERLAAVPRGVYADRARRAAETAVRRLAGSGIEATSAVVPGRPLQAIMDFADQQRADLVVVGSSSRPAVAERLLGSVPL